MRPAQVAALLRVRRPQLSRTARDLARADDVDRLRGLARRRLPRPVFDYVDGGADGEASLHANRAAFEAVRFVPDALAGVTAPDHSATLFGHRLPLPVGLAPTGYTRLVHPDGELAVARAAAAAGVPYVVSTVATTAVEDVAAAGGGPVWAQLYLLADRARSWDYLDRCAAAGVDVLELAVDTAVAGRRTRDVRNGLTIPPQLTLASLAGVLGRPGYWSGYLRAPAMAFPNLRPGGGGGGTVSAITGAFEAALSWADVAEIRSRWPGRFLLKGPLAADDARRAVALGVDGVHLSNHGGRQLDRTVVPLDLLPEVREAVGDGPAVLLDSGVRHGMDVAAAVALGADLVLVGRPYLYGLAVAGEAGVTHVLGLLADQLARTMHLLGAPDLAALRAGGSRFVRPSVR